MFVVMASFYSYKGVCYTTYKMKTLQLHKPHVLVVVGLPAAGKSFFAEQFSEMFQAPYLDFGRFRSAVSDEHQATELANDTFLQLTKTHQTVVIEGIGDKLIERRDIVRVAHKKGYDVLFVWVQTDPQTTEHRAVHAKAATMTLDEYDERRQQFQPLQKTEKSVVISGKHTYATQAKTVLKKLVSGRTDTPASGNSTPTPSPRGKRTADGVSSIATQVATMWTRSASSPAAMMTKPGRQPR